MSITAHFVEAYICIEPILKDGEKSTLQLYRYRWKSKMPSGGHVVAKVVTSESAKQLTQYTGVDIPREARILKELGAHPNIVRYLGYCTEHPSVVHTSILLEPCFVGTLFDFHRVMIRDRLYITNATMWNIFQQLAQAIAFLHEGVSPKELGGVEGWKAVIHCDIRPQNVFIRALIKPNDWKTMQIKLGDFGVASEPGSKPENLSNYVTTLYWAPEVQWKEPKLTDKSDVWAVGAIIHELAHGVGPTCNPETLEQRWKEKYKKLPNLDWADKKEERNYWAAHAPRIVMGVQMETGEDKEFRFQVDPDARRIRKVKVITGYTEDLDHCMKAALKMQAEERHDAYSLLEAINKSLGEHDESVKRWIYVKAEREEAIRMTKLLSKKNLGSA